MITVTVPRPKNVKDLDPKMFDEETEAIKGRLYANEYQRLAARTIKEEMSARDMLFHALHGISSEVGELHGLYQKVYQGHDLDPEHEKKELGDLLWFIAEYCTAKGWNLEDVMRLNIVKLMGRYPEGFDPDKSLHRKKGDI